MIQETGSSTLDNARLRPKQPSERHIPTLDGWRGIAILLVLISHTLIIAYGDRFPTSYSLGQHGVTIFFVLSGFLITRLLLSEQQAQGSIDLPAFYTRRFFRLMPCVWAYLAVVFIRYGFVHPRPFTATEILGSLFFFRNFLDKASLHPVTGHFWSLSIEEQYYLIWPGLLVLSGIRRARWISVAGATAIALYRLDHWNYLSGIPLQATFGTQYRADALLVGCAAALWLSTLLPYLRRWMCLPLLAALYGCIRQYDGLIPLRESVIVGLLLMITSSYPSLLSSLLETKLLRVLGKYSYGLYVWQQLALPMARSTKELLIGLLLLPAIAFMSYRFIEQPLRAFGARFAAKRVT